MLPRWHIILGAAFTFLLWIVAPTTPFSYLALVFFSSFLIDFDHYLCSVLKTGKMSLFDVFDYHKELGLKYKKEHDLGLRKKGDFHLFHTLEFHGLLVVIGLFWVPFFYIFIGMMFHSLLDVLHMMYYGVLYRREYFFFNWLREKI